jgi:hypothetical protein
VKKYDAEIWHLDDSKLKNETVKFPDDYHLAMKICTDLPGEALIVAENPDRFPEYLTFSDFSRPTRDGDVFVTDKGEALLIGPHGVEPVSLYKDGVLYLDHSDPDIVPEQPESEVTETTVNEDDYGKELKQVRPVTRDLIQAVFLDVSPSNAALVDFGIESQRHFEALYRPIREGEITPKELDEAVGNGAKLTALVREAKSNPDKSIVFHTSWDMLYGRKKPKLGPEIDM